MKLLESKYYPDKGFSVVTLKHNGKTYTGNAFYNEAEEKNPPNSFFGQRLAEKRAMIGYWKEQRDINRIKKQALESFKKDMLNIIFSEKENLQENEEVILDKLNQHIKYYDKTAKDYAEVIQIQKDNIQRDIQLREQLFNKVKNS